MNIYVCECWCPHTCLSVHVEVRGQSWALALAFHFGVFAVCLQYEFPGISRVYYLCLSSLHRSSEIPDTCPMHLVFTWVLRIQTQVFVPMWQTLTH